VDQASVKTYAPELQKGDVGGIIKPAEKRRVKIMPNLLVMMDARGIGEDIPIDAGAKSGAAARLLKLLGVGKLIVTNEIGVILEAKTQKLAEIAGEGGLEAVERNVLVSLELIRVIEAILAADALGTKHERRQTLSVNLSGLVAPKLLAAITGDIPGRSLGKIADDVETLGPNLLDEKRGHKFATTTPNMSVVKKKLQRRDAENYIVVMGAAVKISVFAAHEKLDLAAGITNVDLLAETLHKKLVILRGKGGDAIGGERLGNAIDLLIRKIGVAIRERDETRGRPTRLLSQKADDPRKGHLGAARGAMAAGSLVVELLDVKRTLTHYRRMPPREERYREMRRERRRRRDIKDPP
jgi:hypothetical protein